MSSETSSPGPWSKPLGRREFLAAALAASGVVLIAPHAWVAHAATLSPGHKRLVVIFLRGAVDGLNVVVPYSDNVYYEARPTIAIPRVGEGAVLDLDGHFGLNPALGALIPAWREGTLAFVHACGSPDPTRSHFDAQDYMESGTPGIKLTPDGWMNRTLAEMSGYHGATEALSLGPVLPRILSGTMPVANIALGRGAPSSMALDHPRIEQAFDLLYSGSDPLSRAYQEGRAARRRLLGELQQDITQLRDGASSPEHFTDQAVKLADLIRRDPTIRLAFIALGGWDTHIEQGAVSGQLTNHLKPLGDGLAAFARQLQAAYDDTVIVVVSEFGRTVHENGNGGTDHGHGNVMWVMGGRVRGRRVYGDWPGLSAAELYQERDLAVTTDFREPLARILRIHLGVPEVRLERVFPARPADRGRFEALIKV